MVKALINASVGLLLATAAVTAYSQSAGAGEKEVLQALYAADQADDKRDKAALERLTADDYLYHSSNGNILTKAQAIAETMAGGTTWANRIHIKSVPGG